MGASNKKVIKGFKVVRDPGGDNDDLSQYCQGWTLEPPKAEHDVSGGDDKVDQTKKGTAKHSLTINWIRPIDDSALLQKLIGDYNGDDDVEYHLMLDNAGVPSPTNLQYRVMACITTPGQIGGQRNSPHTASTTWPCNSVSVHDGTTATPLE